MTTVRENPDEYGWGYPFDPSAKPGDPFYRPGPDWPPSLEEMAVSKAMESDPRDVWGLCGDSADEADG